jgi:hypothetical protein
MQEVTLDGNFEEIIVSVRPSRATRWLRLDVAIRLTGVLVVTAITPTVPWGNRDAAKMVVEGGIGRRLGGPGMY